MAFLISVIPIGLATDKGNVFSISEVCIGIPIADVAISKRPLLFTVWTQLRLRSHQKFYEIFTRKQFLPTSAGNAQA